MAAPEYLTVRELAELLRIKERKVYDLAASGEVPCSRATGKLLFPARDVRAWLDAGQSGGEAEPAPPIILGSHDPLLDWAIRQSGSGIATYFDGSLDGVSRLLDGAGIAAGLHLYDAASGTWNIATARQMAATRNVVLLEFARRQRGLLVRDGARLPAGLHDLAGLTLVPRQPGSGTDTVLRALLAADGIDADTLSCAAVCRTEDEAADAVRLGEGDVTLGLEALARSYGLRFVPVIEEQFALLVDRRGYFDVPFQALLGFIGTDAFARRAEALGGYDVTGAGRVLWNAG